MERKIVTIVDHFFGNDLPRVQHLAETLPYYDREILHKERKHWPGARTDCLSIVAPDFYAELCPKIFDAIFDITCMKKLEARMTVYFQRIESFSDDASDPINLGWIHQDNTNLSGIIYVKEHEHGTNINQPIIDDKLKQELETGEWKVDDDTKYRFFNHDETLDLNDYRDAVVKHNTRFKPDIQVGNNVDRLFTFTGDYWHNAVNYHGTTPRYTIVFFLHELHVETYPAQQKEIFVKPHHIALYPC
jgi:hypothetical protein